MLASDVSATRALQLRQRRRAVGLAAATVVAHWAPPVRLSGTLADVGVGDMRPMAQPNYLNTRIGGATRAADRVRASGGYQEKLVGENLHTTPNRPMKKVLVQGWIGQSGIAKIMDPRFARWASLMPRVTLRAGLLLGSTAGRPTGGGTQPNPQRSASRG